MNTTVLAPPPLSAPFHTAPPPRSQLGDFFRHHGVWAPAVRLFRQLGFGAKASLISLCFLLPMGMLLGAYISTQQETIRFATREQAGVALVQALNPWVIEAQKQRRRVLSGLQPQLDMAAIEAQRDKALPLFAEHKEGIDLDKALKPVAQRHQALASAAATQPPAAALAEPLQAYVDSLVQLRTSVLDQSYLSLDPEQASYYLMSVSVDQVSAVIESVSRSRALSGLLDRSPPASPADLRQLYAIWFAGKERLLSLGDQLARAAEAEPEVVRRLDWDETLATTNAFFDAADKAWFQASFSGQVAALEQPGQAAVDALRAFSADGSHQLDGLLQHRIDQASQARNRVIGGVALSLLLVAYLFYSFYLVMRGGLGEVARHLQAMTDGDLTTSPRPWGRDEAAALMLSLAEMQASLRAIVGEVRSASDQLVHASSEIASASSDLSQRSEEAAANLEESAAAIEQMASTVQQGATNTGQAAQLSSRNAEVAETSGRNIASVVATMDKVQTSSARIGEIIGVIDGIAFQTNILALNAAVEAARAGDQGRGFAVVAGEVRALAHRSANAAKEIKQLIGASVDHVAAGGQVVSQAGQTIRALVTNADRMKALLAEIATGASEQSAGIGQIGQAIQALDRQTQQNAALVEETAAAAEQLQDQAQALVARVARFRMPA